MFYTIIYLKSYYYLKKGDIVNKKCLKALYKTVTGIYYILIPSIRHPCDQCDFSATQQSYLSRHKKTHHLGIRFPCPECDFFGTRPSTVKRHMLRKHTKT